MRIFTTLILFGSVLLIAGCLHSKSTFQQHSPRLTKTEVVEIALTVAQKAKESLDNYQSPTINFDSKEMRWSVYWNHKPPGYPGGYICVFVDDKTGSGQFMPSD